MKTALVTGATGFLGQQVVPALRDAGFTVTTNSRGPSTFELAHLPGDLADESVAAAILGRSWNTVIDLAGPVTGGAEDLPTGIDVVRTHVRIALHIRRYASPARIVHASSMTVYGLPTTIPITEGHPRKPRHLYGLAKALSEDVLLGDPALDTWVLRLPGLFSEQRASGALYHFCRATRAGETLRVSAPAPTPWDVLHVADAAVALVAAATSTSKSAGALNVSYGEPIELSAIARRIAAFGDSRVEVANVEHPVFQMNIEKARRTLGWSPPTLESRLARLYSDYEGR